jgi:hypothetical protein
MVDATRFQFRLPAAQRAQLETLAAQSGLSSADLTRLALQRLLEDRDARDQGQIGHAERATEAQRNLHATLSAALGGIKERQ